VSDEPVWSAGVAEIKLGTWRDALTAAAGNITRAARAVGISRGYATVLVKKFDLSEFAAELRAKAGGVRVRGGERKGTVTGRPKSR
jgi:hypothetical protein